MAEELGRSTGSRRHPWSSGSFREVWEDPADVFRRSTAGEEDEADLHWAALEKLPTYDRMRKGVLRQVVEGDTVATREVEIAALGIRERKDLIDRVLRAVQEDNERLLRRLRERIDRVGIEVPKIEVRFENLSVEGDAHVGKRAIPTLLNATLDAVEGILGLAKLSLSKKRAHVILRGVSGIIKPSRMTLLLGPPGAGKTTFLLALAGKLDNNLRQTGRITYCGHELSEFVPQRTCAYISQQDLHNGEMTVRETLEFSGHCMGVGTRYEMLAELSRREKDAGIKPDPEIDAFMKATALEDQHTKLITEYNLKMLGLDICADILVGNEMRRGISGGQKKRVTTGEMLVGPSRALFMDEISTGLDSSTTFQIVRHMKHVVHVMDGTTVISLLQPAPETYNLFDDIILLSEGHIVYQGPRESILGFFEFMGFRCPERKGVADFLQEVTSKKDQEQYWFKNEPYRYVPVNDFVKGFDSFYVGQNLKSELGTPYDRSKTHPAALSIEKYGLSSWELLKVCFSREWLLMKRNSFIYVFKTVQITFMSVIAMSIYLRTQMPHETIADGGKFLGALFYSLCNVMFNGTAEMSMTVHRLPVFYKQRDFLFYPPWAFALPIWILKIPISLLESAIWIILTYYTIGFAPAPDRFFKQFLAFFFINQMALAVFRFISAVGRTPVVTNTFGNFALLAVFVLGGFVISKNDIKDWLLWAYYLSPMMYGQNALTVNEFLDKRWSSPNTDPNIEAPTVGTALLKSRGLFTDAYWYWISIGALAGFSIIYNLFFIAALTFLDPYEDSHTISAEDGEDDNHDNTSHIEWDHGCRTAASTSNTGIHNGASEVDGKRGMVLPFTPLSLTFNHVNYYVDMPHEMKNQGITEDRLQLLCDVSGAFRPGVLTALVGVSGAGKTTLMDVLSGRKTEGYIEGSINISGYPKNQATFARISGYCEQNDIHSPNVTVYESLVYSAWLRLSPEVKPETRRMFVDEVLELIELDKIRDAMVGLPGVNGLSTEQRKRLTIAVELVANPSIIFMDEPTSGLDARAAAIVMRTVRNTVDTGRTVVCTIHQPSIDIFESFDELLLMKIGGQVIYAGPLGRCSQNLIEYFEVIPGVPKIKEDYNPATWMLEISSISVESQLNLDFSDIYSNSSLYQNNQCLIKELDTSASGSKDLYFPTKYSQSFFAQCMACFWKQYWSYWRNPSYNAVRFFSTIIIAAIFGIIFWDKGQRTGKQQDLLNVLGAIYAAIFFLGASNSMTVQPVVAIERTVFYRERAAGMYSALAYAFAQVLIEVLYIASQSIVYSLLLFSMIGFEWKAGKFFYFVFFLGMCLLYFVLYGMMAVALTPGYQIAAIVMSFFFSLWNLFSGFLIFRPLIPIWWRWYFWASPIAWTIYGIVVSQFGDKDAIVDIPGQGSTTVKAFLKDVLGYEYDFLPYIVVAHVGFVLLFFFVFAYGIKFLNFQKR